MRELIIALMTNYIPFDGENHKFILNSQFKEYVHENIEWIQQKNSYVYIYHKQKLLFFKEALMYNYYILNGHTILDRPVIQFVSVMTFVMGHKTYTKQTQILVWYRDIIKSGNLF